MKKNSSTHSSLLLPKHINVGEKTSFFCLVKRLKLTSLAFDGD